MASTAIKRTLLSLTVAYVTALMCFCTVSYAAVPESARAARVLQVIDGDTLIVDIRGQREHVRLIGIDTPETRHNHRSQLQSHERNLAEKTILQFGNRASNFTRELLPKKSTVFLEFDVSRRDKYQRLLAYAWIMRGTPETALMVNEEILRAGYAYSLTVPPNVKHRERLALAFAEGRREKRGLWQ
jgi:micrococcal nuclease